MTTGKHSPSQWHTDTEYYDGKQFAVHSKNGALIATIAKQVKTPIDPEKGFATREVANAKLIAAAPDLLEALTNHEMEMCLLEFSTYDKKSNGYRAYEKIMSAIKKATE